MTKLERMREAASSGDRETAVILAHELLTAHGHESGRDAFAAFLAHGYANGHKWDAYREALSVVNA
jgi:hypothetical protein